MPIFVEVTSWELSAMDADAADENTNKNKTMVTEAKAAECNFFFWGFAIFRNIPLFSIISADKVYFVEKFGNYSASPKLVG